MKAFLTDIEQRKVVEAIAEAEACSRGELRVVITSKDIADVEQHAWKVFRQLGMHRTLGRNAALILVAERSKRFAVIGDTELAAVVEEGYWQSIVAEMTRHLQDGRCGDALVAGIQRLAATLANAWPATGDNPDELPNEISHE